MFISTLKSCNKSTANQHLHVIYFRENTWLVKTNDDYTVTDKKSVVRNQVYVYQYIKILQ